MIVRLDKQKQRTARHQLFNDVVYIISHEVLKQMQREGNTELSPVEVFLSARNFCDSILKLPDIEEGLDDEIDDLEDEAGGKDDYKLILVLSTVQLQAISKRRVGIDFKKIIFRIFERLDGYEFLWPLFKKMTIKEDTRCLEGKKTNLLEYEVQEIKLEGGGSEEIRQLFEDLLHYSDKMGETSIKELLLFLERYNLDHNHAYDKEILTLFEKIGIKCTTIIRPNEYVGTKFVKNEIQNVEGGIGIVKGMQKE